MKRDSAYYQKSRQANLEFDHPGLKLLKEQAGGAAKILEVGCGEGTKLAKVCSSGSKGWGVDISPLALKMAKKEYPKLSFIKADAVKLPFKDNFFDLVYSAFVLEHLDQPQKAVEEMIRVLKEKGSLVLLAPNYGAPNRASPCYKRSRLKEFLRGFLKDVFLGRSSLDWERVEPLEDKKGVDCDWDTVVEPYLLSLEQFLKEKGLRVLESTSFWRLKQAREPVYQQVFKLLGGLGVYPFYYWGPHLFIACRKS